MARKTKKEKILAEYHRKLASLRNNTPGEDKNILAPQVKTNTYSLNTHPVTINQPLNNGNKNTVSYSYVFSDLRRILILTVLAICAQLVLWYLLGAHLLRIS